MILHYFPLFILSLVFMSVKFEFVCVSQREDNKNTKTQFSNCLSPKRKKKHSTKSAYSIEFDCVERASRQRIVYILFLVDSRWFAFNQGLIRLP